MTVIQRRRSVFSLLTGLMLFLWFPVAGRAATVETTVKYIAADAVYIDSGSDDGIQQGDAAEVLRDGQLVATMKVAFVARTSASCTLINAAGTVQVGDIAIVTTTMQDIVEEEESIQPSEPDILTPVTGRTQAKTIKKSGPRLMGHIGLQYRIQDNLDEFDYDYRQPSAVVRLRADNLFSSHYTVNVRLRTRRTLRDRTTSSSTEDKWNNRIYEVSFGYDNPDSPIGYQVGRILSNRISGIGTMDGMMGEYRISSNWKAGLFVGTQPDLQNTRPQTDETKAGVYLYREGLLTESIRASGTFALAGRYNKGEISKEFIYEQVNARIGRTWGIYQSAEIGINRGWRKEAEGTSLTLSNILVNLRWMPSRMLTAHVGYDTRTIVRTIETRDTPDSLFDDAYRQGLRGGFTLRLPHRINLTANAGLRFTEGQDEVTQTFSGGLGQYDILGSGIRADARVNVYKNLFTTGIQPSFRIDRNLFGRLSTAVQIGQNRYEITDRSEAVVNNWLKVSLDARLSRLLYAAAYAEFYRGDSFEANSYFVETGLRF